MEFRSNHVAARVRDIAPFHVMEVQTAARALEAAGRSVVHMEIGEPDFPTPPQVLAAAQQAIARGDIYYTSALGIPELREAIARYYGERFGVALPGAQVMVTAGSSAAAIAIHRRAIPDLILTSAAGRAWFRCFLPRAAPGGRRARRETLRRRHSAT